MLKQAAGNIKATRVADAALAASRQVWLAGLGAAIVTRDWARNDAGDVFRTLIKEGEAVETRAVRVIGKQIDSSLVIAASTWNKARHTALSTVNGLIDTAATAWPRLKPALATGTKSPAKRKKVATMRRAKRSGRKA